MAIKWNEDQTKVIQSVDADTLVSASAGSGKTSVMIERVVRLIKSGVPIGSIVMLTFSNAVAAELRERIAAALMKAMREDGANKEELRRQIDGIAMADIGTVHSFCGNLIKEFSEQAGVDPSYSIVTDDEKSGLIARAIAEVFASYGESADEDIEALRLYFGGERKFAAAIVRALNYVAAQPDRDGWLARAADGYSVDGRCTDVLMDELRVIARRLRANAAEAAELIERFGFDEGDLGSYRAVVQGCDAVLSAQDISDLGAAKPAFSADKFVLSKRNSKLKGDGAYVTLRELGGKCVKDYSALAAQVGVLLSCSESEWRSRGENARRYTVKFIEAVRRVAQSYDRLKRDDNKLDFNDLEYYAIKILDDPDVREELRSRYRYVCIDEYQDTNYVQEHIVNAISNGKNLFMVGDPKQSIYRFRLTEIGIFVDKFDRYLAHPEQGNALTLNGNYRSDKRVLDFVNTMFSVLMTKDRGGIDYANTSLLTTTAQPFGDQDGETVEILLFSRKRNTAPQYEPEDGVYSVAEDVAVDKDSSTRAEALGVAKRIKELVGTDIPEKDEKGDLVARKARYSDIAILCEKRSAAVFSLLRCLADNGIPVDCTMLDQENECEAVERLSDFFAVIANPRDDVRLTSVMLSVFGGFTHEEAAKIRSAYRNEKFFHEAAAAYRDGREDELALKLRAFYKMLDRYALIACQNDAATLADIVIADFDYDKYVTAADGDEEAAMLTLFVDSLRGKSYAATLQSVVAYLEETGYKSPALQNAADGDCVRVMTIHKSKGLEFPIVFSVCSDGRFRSDRSDIMFDRDGGIALRALDREGRTKPDTLKFIALAKTEERQNLEEKTRLLYVAYTRAKYRLIITGTKNQKFPRTDVERKSALECIEEVCQAVPEFMSRYVKICDDDEGTESAVSESGGALFSEPDPDVVAKLKERLARRYPYQESTEIALKHTVTGINAAQDEPARELFAEVTETGWFGGESAARGTAYHKALERIDYDLVDESEIADALDEMCDGGYLTIAERKELDESVILGCLRSELIGRARVSEHWREKQFMLCVPADKLFGGTATDNVLVQGTIDLIVFDRQRGETLLVDFKKTNKPTEQLRLRYSRQLELYAYAVEHGLGVKVDKKLLYVLGRNEVIEI